ncbi:hypothetical protein VaNZ11_003616, partial [Volvox africanus]
LSLKHFLKCIKDTTRCRSIMITNDISEDSLVWPSRGAYAYPAPLMLQPPSSPSPVSSPPSPTPPSPTPPLPRPPPSPVPRPPPSPQPSSPSPAQRLPPSPSP